jgi:hypothetical protein
VVPLSRIAGLRLWLAVKAPDRNHDVCAGTHFPERNMEVQHPISADTRLKFDSLGHNPYSITPESGLGFSNILMFYAGAKNSGGRFPPDGGAPPIAARQGGQRSHF